MDGTAGLVLPLASLEEEGDAGDPYRACQRAHGGIIRMDTTRSVVYLCFTGHEFGEGGGLIADTLRAYGAPASFFLTGDFYRDPRFRSLIHRLREDGHYLGAHSDRHLLYAAWEDRDSLLVSREVFEADIAGNLHAMAELGIPPDEARVFMPPYEWYNQAVASWSTRMGLTLVNFTPGTWTNADYTVPEMGERYRSSQTIIDRLLQCEANGPSGLNGAILLMHVGTDPARVDKLYARLGEILRLLRARGYEFARFF